MATVREVDFSDVEQVSALTDAVGWGRTGVAGWHRLWRQNPALSMGKFARGWVLEEAGSIVGYLCNIARLYRYGGITLRAASAASLIVRPDFRGLSLELFLQYARQQDVDLLLNTTAAPHVTRICEFLKFDRIPQRDYDVSLCWILRSRLFATAVLRKRQLSAPWHRWIGAVLAPATWAYAAQRHRLHHVTPKGIAISVIAPEAIDDAFDELWERSTSTGDRLLAYRTAAALRWQFASRADPQWPFLVVAHADDRVIGYAAVVRQDARHLDLARARFGDVFVEGDEPKILRAVLGAAIREAGRRGAAMIELIGFPQRVRAAAQGLGPLELRSESWPFVYRARDRELQRALAREEAWYASLFDGDGSL